MAFMSVVVWIAHFVVELKLLLGATVGETTLLMLLVRLKSFLSNDTGLLVVNHALLRVAANLLNWLHTLEELSELL